MRRKKSITLNGVTYDGLAEAASALGYSKCWIARVVKSGATELARRTHPKAARPKKEVTVGGVTYASMREAEVSLYGKATGRIGKLMARNGKPVADPKRPNKYTEIRDSLGNSYDSVADMAAATGLKKNTIYQRLLYGKFNPPHLNSGRRSGKRRARYWYRGVVYDNMPAACKWLHHRPEWVRINCVELPVYDYTRTAKLDKWMSINYAVVCMYEDARWTEDRVIAECDRRMKKLFAHGKLLKPTKA